MSIRTSVVCHYCGALSELVTGDVIYPNRQDLAHKYFYRCSPCKAYVGCHPPADENGKGGNGDGTVPLGILAKTELRKLKSQTHAIFDPLWKDIMPRKRAYRLLANQLNIDIDDCHIGLFDEEMCRRAIDICSNGLE